MVIKIKQKIMNETRNKTGFSLIEMIVASIILSLAVVSICAVSTKSMTNVRSNRDYEIAWDLLDRMLTEIDYKGIEEFIAQGQMSGQFGSQEEGGAVHYWEADYEDGDYDNLYRLNLSISWGSAGRKRKITASTILNGSGMMFEDEEQEDAVDES